MKKYIIVIIFLSLMISSTIATNYSTGTIKEIGSTGPNINSLEILAKVGLFFCNSGINAQSLTKTINTDIRPGGKTDICILFLNQNNNPVQLIPGFSSGYLGEQGEFLCDENDSEDNNIGKFINADRKNKEIEIKPNGFITHTATISIPKYMSGKQYICFGVSLVEPENTTVGGMFKLRHRKGVKIKINITGDVYNYGPLYDLQKNISESKETIIKIFLGIIGIRLLISIVQTLFHKDKKHKI